MQNNNQDQHKDENFITLYPLMSRIQQNGYGHGMEYLISEIKNAEGFRPSDNPQNFNYRVSCEVEGRLSINSKDIYIQMKYPPEIMNTLVCYIQLKFAGITLSHTQNIVTVLTNHFEAIEIPQTADAITINLATSDDEEISEEECNLLEKIPSFQRDGLDGLIYRLVIEH